MCTFYIHPALDEAKAAYQVWLDVRAKRDEVLTEKHSKKPAPYKHVKVGNEFFAVACNIHNFSPMHTQ